MAYTLEIRPSASRELRKLPPPVRSAIEEAIEELAADPRPAGSRKLKANLGFRIRYGKYRVRYAIDDAARVVTVLQVGLREHFYD